MNQGGIITSYKMILNLSVKSLLQPPEICYKGTMQNEMDVYGENK